MYIYPGIFKSLNILLWKKKLYIEKIRYQENVSGLVLYSMKLGQLPLSYSIAEFPL